MKNIKHLVLVLFITYFVINFFNIEEYLMNIFRFFLLIVLILFSIYSINKVSKPTSLIKKRIFLSIFSLLIIIVSYFFINYI